MSLAMNPGVRVGLMLMAALLPACVVGPDFKSPEAPKTSHYTDPVWIDADQLDGQQLVDGMLVPAEWWEMFGSGKLDALVRRGLENSLTVAAARARLREVQEDLKSQAGAVLFPSVDANASSSRRKISGTSFGGESLIFTLHNASVSASYGVDLFGANTRHLESLESQINYEQFQLQAARMTLAANIVTAAVREASLREQIRATDAIIEDSRKQLSMIEKQFELGAVAQSVVLTQRSELAQARTALPELHRQMQQNRHLLAVLVGELPSESKLSSGNKLPEFRLADMSLPRTLPLSLPSDLVRQRPDILASEALLHQANANVGLATANLYPRITISASYGSESRTAANLFRTGSTVWDAGTGLVQPLFHGGELRARKRGTEAALAQADANYRGVVLAAFKDVADTLLALQADAQGLQLQREAEQVAKASYELSREQYTAGAVSYLEMLTASQAYHRAAAARAVAEGTRLADSAALVHALGGGWWNTSATDMQEANTDETSDHATTEKQL